MLLAKAGVAALLLIVYGSAISLPCESDEPAGGHGNHASLADTHTHEEGPAAGSTRGPCHEPPLLLARCPCGCDERSGARTPGAKLGPTILAAGPELADPIGPMRAPASSRDALGVALLPPDPIPI